MLLRALCGPPVAKLTLSVEANATISSHAIVSAAIEYRSSHKTELVNGSGKWIDEVKHAAEPLHIPGIVCLRMRA